MNFAREVWEAMADQIGWTGRMLVAVGAGVLALAGALKLLGVA